MIKKEYRIPSKTGITDLYIQCWSPEGDIKAAFQMAHGMAEHSGRYDEFAEFLCSKGYIVFMDDHAGHGRSVRSDDDLGYFGEKNGWNALVEDEEQVTELIRREYPDLPIVFYGHSMGSFIGREYIRRYGSADDLKGAVICGTSGKNPAAGIAIYLADAVAKIRGSHYRSKFINYLAFGAYNKKIASPRTKFDWLTTDSKIVDKYIEDKYCGFIFSAAAFRDLFTILNFVSGKKWFDGVDKELPVYLIAGEDDPVGSYGKGVKEVYNGLKNAGVKNVVIKLYPGMRHEIHNEPGRQAVYEDVAAFVASVI